VAEKQSTLGSLVVLGILVVVGVAWVEGSCGSKANPIVLAGGSDPSKAFVRTFEWSRVLPDGSISTANERIDTGMLGDLARDAAPEAMLAYTAQIENTRLEGNTFDLVIEAERLWRGEWQVVDRWRVPERLAGKQKASFEGKLRSDRSRLTALDHLRVSATIGEPTVR